eukprot:31244-Pelagococcus_subviridis.AAC.8
MRIVGKFKTNKMKNMWPIHVRKLKYIAIPGPNSTPRSPTPIFSGYVFNPLGPWILGWTSSACSSASCAEGGMYSPRFLASSRFVSLRLRGVGGDDGRQPVRLSSRRRRGRATRSVPRAYELTNEMK